MKNNYYIITALDTSRDKTVYLAEHVRGYYTWSDSRSEATEFESLDKIPSSIPNACSRLTNFEIRHTSGSRKDYFEARETAPSIEAEYKMKTLECTNSEFLKLVENFTETLEDHRDEFYTTEQEFAELILTKFYNFIWAEDLEMQEKYKQYLELKKLFENQ